LSIKTITSIFVGKDEKKGLINERTVYASGTFSANVDDENKCIYEVKITPKSVKLLLLSKKTNRDNLSEINCLNTIARLQTKSTLTVMSLKLRS